MLTYEDGSSSAALLPAASAAAAAAAGGSDAAATLMALRHSVLAPYNGTGVLAALTAALALKPPRWVCPISDRESCAALPAPPPPRAGAGASSSGASALGWGTDAKARAAQGGMPGVLRDCVLMRSGSTVEDVYHVLKRPPYCLLDGDFVRAECRLLNVLQQQQQQQQQQHGVSTGQQGGSAAKGAACRVVRKDERLGRDSCVLLLQTNRHTVWQAAARRHACAADG